MKNCLFGSFVVVGLALIVIAPACAEEKSITGTYECVGDNGDGTSYKGTLKIVKFGDVFELTWTIGETSHTGVGIFENHALCCSWSTTVDGKTVKGVVVYKIEKDKMTGRWASHPTNGKVLTETLTKK